MNISCPICDTSIEVSKFLVGQKGRCPKCASKFIIPESPDDEMEILERGEIPEEPEPEPAVAAAEPEAAPAPRKKKKKRTAPKPAARSSEPPRVSVAPRVMPATGAAVRTPVRPVMVKRSSGAFGFLFAIVLAGLIGAIVYVVMEKQKNQHAAELAAIKAENNRVEKKVVEQPNPRPQPVAPVQPVEEPEPDGFPVYAKVVQPFLEAKCVSCHGLEKAKGRLAMHTMEKLAAGSGNGSVLEPDPDFPDRIEMIFRSELPEADEEHMPPSGEPQLTADELVILKWWIKAGAHEDIESSEAPEDVRKKLQDLAKL